MISRVACAVCGWRSTWGAAWIMRHLRLWHAVAFSLCLLLTWAAPPVQAQDATPTRSKRTKRAKRAKDANRTPRSADRRRGKRRPRGRAATTPESASSVAGDTPPAPEDETSAREPATTSPAPARKERSTDSAASRAAESAATGSKDVDSEVVKEGDTSVKVMRFSGLDVEGRLKSPQLLYFVNRVRAEFDRPKLPHRSFMPELERSTKRDPL